MRHVQPVAFETMREAPIPGGETVGTAEGLFSPARPCRHPLHAAVLAYFASHRDGDVTSLAHWLGAPARPRRGVQAYRIVAADVLCCLAAGGLLVQYGHVPPRPEDGGHWYRLPADGAKAPGEVA